MKTIAQKRLEDLLVVEDTERIGLITKNNATSDYLDEINETIKGKTLVELIKLEQEARETLNTNQFAVDIEFWDEMLTRIMVERCSLELSQIFERNYGKKAEDFISSKNIDIKTHVVEEKGIEEKPEFVSNTLWNSYPVYDYKNWLNKLQANRLEVLKKEVGEMRGKLKYQIKKRQITKSDVKVLLEKMQTAEEINEDD